jgi:hypothetical protein
VIIGLGRERGDVSRTLPKAMALPYAPASLSEPDWRSGGATFTVIPWRLSAIGAFTSIDHWPPRSPAVIGIVQLARPSSVDRERRLGARASIPS